MVSVVISAIVVWSMWQIFASDSQLSTVFQYSVWVIGILTIVTVFLAASLVKIKLRLASNKDRLLREELEQNLSVLSSTFEATAEGILVVDLNNKIVTYNRHFVEMAQVPDEIIRSKDNDKVIAFVSEQVTDPEFFVEKTNYWICWWYGFCFID